MISKISLTPQNSQESRLCVLTRVAAPRAACRIRCLAASDVISHRRAWIIVVDGDDHVLPVLDEFPESLVLSRHRRQEPVLLERVRIRHLIDPQCQAWIAILIHLAAQCPILLNVQTKGYL